MRCTLGPPCLGVRLQPHCRGGRRTSTTINAVPELGQPLKCRPYSRALSDQHKNDTSEMLRPTHHQLTIWRTSPPWCLMANNLVSERFDNTYLQSATLYHTPTQGVFAADGQTAAEALLDSACAESTCCSCLAACTAAFSAPKPVYVTGPVKTNGWRGW